jgi:hypothetical protein
MNSNFRVRGEDFSTDFGITKEAGTELPLARMQKDTFEKHATIFDKYDVRVTIESKAGHSNESYTELLNALKDAGIMYREDARYTIKPDRVCMDILVQKEDLELIETLKKELEDIFSFVISGNLPEYIQNRVITTEEFTLDRSKEVKASKKTASTEWVSKDGQIKIYETASDFQIEHIPSGESRGMGDGVDLFSSEEGESLDVDTPEFYAQMAEYVNDPELLDAYFPDRVEGSKKVVAEEKRYSTEELADMPTVSQGHFEDLKVNTADTRIWLSRMTVEDGMPYNNQVTVEKLVDGNWTTVEEYSGDEVTASKKVAAEEKRYSTEELEDMPTISQGQFDNLKVQTDDTRVWVSRMTVEDGMPYNNQVTVEKLEEGNWVVGDEYSGDEVGSSDLELEASLVVTAKWYVGLKDGIYEAFSSEEYPTEDSFGELYKAVIGPFKTRRGAEFMAAHGQGNPHLRSADDADRIAAEYARTQRASIGFGHKAIIEAIEDLDGDIALVEKEGLQKNVAFIAEDGGRLCYDAVKQEYDLIRSNTEESFNEDGANNQQWAIVGMDINEEDSDMVCDHLGTKIEPLHGEATPEVVAPASGPQSTVSALKAKKASYDAENSIDTILGDHFKSES